MEYNAKAELGALPGSLAAREPAANYVNRILLMTLHALTIAKRWSRADRQLVLWLAAVCSLAGCNRNRVGQQIVNSPEEAWLASACSPVETDVSTWARRRVGGVTIAVPPGYVVEQGPLTSMSIRNESRRSHIAFNFIFPQEARQTFDALSNNRRPRQSACEGRLSGYPVDVIGTYDRGQFALTAFWEASWGGEDAGRWLQARVTSNRLEEAIELRAVLHTIRPIGAN